MASCSEDYLTRFPVSLCCVLQPTDVEGERASLVTGDYLPEGPNLSTFYSAVDVDLSTLSELTESVPGKEAQRVDGSRSKRTCVRVREGISRLEEILGNGGSSSPPTRSVGQLSGPIWNTGLGLLREFALGGQMNEGASQFMGGNWGRGAGGEGGLLQESCLCWFICEVLD